MRFIRLDYTPRDDIICLFYVEPAKGKTMLSVANTLALESSVGTWTNIKAPKRIKQLDAKVFSIHGNLIKVAYPSQLFEKGNVPNILSSVAGNIFGMKAVKNLRLEDISFPKSIIKSFKGPRFGTKGVRKKMKVKKRPFVGTIIKPKLGLNPKEHAESAYNSWLGGCDFVKDDENLASQTFNKFEKRLSKTLEMRDKAEKETGEKKAYLINVTAETDEMVKRAELVKKQGGKYAMVDIMTVGWAGLQTLRAANLNLILHGHRAMHAALTRNDRHGIRMIVLADFARLIGVDQLHIGTGIGKLEGEIKDIVELEEEIEFNQVRHTKYRLNQKWYHIKPTLAVSSGGLHPGHVPYLVRHLGKNIVIQAGGGIHGHPLGSIAGAKAMRQAVDAIMKRQHIQKHAEKHVELKKALEFWDK